MEIYKYFHYFVYVFNNTLYSRRYIKIFYKIMKILKLLLMFFFFTFHVQAKELPKINTKFYLGIYKSFDKLTSVATSKYHSLYPYHTSTDAEKENLGFFLGYNFYLDNLLLGIETSFQENIGKDNNPGPNLNGTLTYEKLKEIKFNIGYNFKDFVIFTYLGIGDVHPSWSSYQSDPPYIRDYWTRGFAINYKLNENYFIGLNFDETTFDINYLYSHYVEEVHKQSARLRFGYIF